jgi:hypothetical protein
MVLMMELICMLRPLYRLMLMDKRKSRAGDRGEYQRTWDCFGWKLKALETRKLASKTWLEKHNSLSDCLMCSCLLVGLNAMLLTELLLQRLVL